MCKIKIIQEIYFANLFMTVVLIVMAVYCSSAQLKSEIAQTVDSE